jgi:hypothetical protein
MMRDAGAAAVVIPAQFYPWSRAPSMLAEEHEDHGAGDEEDRSPGKQLQ